MNVSENQLTRHQSTTELVRRAIAAIEETKRSGGGVPANVVIAKLEAKLAAARDRKL